MNLVAETGTILVIGLLSISTRHIYVVLVKTIYDGSIRLAKPAVDATKFIWS